MGGGRQIKEKKKKKRIKGRDKKKRSKEEAKVKIEEIQRNDDCCAKEGK